MDKTIGVVGSWHLASVIIGCLVEKGFSVRVADQSKENIGLLQKGSLPIFEPELEGLIKNGIKAGKLSFSNDFKAQLEDTDIVYFAKDTTKTESGVDLEDIFTTVQLISDLKKKSFTLILSSQLPVGTCEQLKNRVNQNRKEPVHFVHVPEFLRLGNAVSLFRNQDYTIIGCDSLETYELCSGIFSHFSKNIFRMKLSEAELAKHIANCFVATTVSFISEITKIADRMNVDLMPVGKALRFDKRIGSKSYILPGLGFTGGNVERDIKVLQGALKKFGETSDFLDAVVQVNDEHNRIVVKKLEKVFEDFSNLKIAFLGITYKAFTNTLRGSLTIAAGEELVAKGCRVSAYDPLITDASGFVHQGIQICSGIKECLEGADAAVVMIEKPEFRDLTPQDFSRLLRRKIVMDAANMFNAKDFIEGGFKYAAIGRGVTW